MKAPSKHTYSHRDWQPAGSAPYSSGHRIRESHACDGTHQFGNLPGTALIPVISPQGRSLHQHVRLMYASTYMCFVVTPPMPMLRHLATVLFGGYRQGKSRYCVYTVRDTTQCILMDCETRGNWVTPPLGIARGQWESSKYKCLENNRWPDHRCQGPARVQYFQCLHHHLP